MEINQRPLELIQDLFLIPKIQIFFEKNLENRPKKMVFKGLKAGSSRIKIFKGTGWKPMKNVKITLKDTLFSSGTFKKAQFLRMRW